MKEEKDRKGNGIKKLDFSIRIKMKFRYEIESETDAFYF